MFEKKKEKKIYNCPICNEPIKNIDKMQLSKKYPCSKCGKMFFIILEPAYY
jgi:DNA-directed RNA polymerase subunit RPC12/RpoP